MTDQDDTEGLKRWEGIMNKNRGYGGAFNHNTPEDKIIVERATAEEWCRAIAAEFDLQVGRLEHNPTDPPDCFADFDGRRIGVELVQLITQNHLERAAQKESPHAGSLFSDMQWTPDRFSHQLNEVLNTKGAKYAAKRLQIDVLVIHTTEPWLTSNQARGWLSETEVAGHPSISNAFLLFDYEPGYHDPAGASQHWPVIWLYGDMGRGE
jgi:hypothetical protein